MPLGLDSYLWPNAKEMHIPSSIAKENLSKKCIFSSEGPKNPSSVILYSLYLKIPLVNSKYTILLKKKIQV